MKFLAMLFLITSFAHAGVSCDISFHGLDRLKLTDAEQAKLEIYLKTQNYNFDPKIIYGGMGYGVQFNSLHLPQDQNQQGMFLVKNLDRPQKLAKIEIPLSRDGEPLKVLKPKKNFLGLFHDKGTSGFVLAMGIARDLPDCNEKNSIAINDADREIWGKQNLQGNGLQGGQFSIGTSGTVFGL